MYKNNKSKRTRFYKLYKRILKAFKKEKIIIKTFINNK
jgi:hypothetical protein